MSQPRVHSGRSGKGEFSEGAGHEHRTHTHACEFARAHRTDRDAWRDRRPQQGRARPCGCGFRAAGRPRDRRRTRGVRRGPPERVGYGFCHGVGGQGVATPATGLGTAGFFGNRSRGVVDAGAVRTRARSAVAGDRARARHRRRVADRRRRAGLRCARRRRAGSLGRGASARSRRQPKTHLGRGGLRRHRAAVADGRSAAALDRGNQMDRARGAFAAVSAMDRLGRACLRRATGSPPSWPGRPLDHGMELR